MHRHTREGRGRAAKRSRSPAERAEHTILGHRLNQIIDRIGVERLPGRPVDLEVELSKPVLLTLEVTDESGTVVVEEPLGLAESGTRTARWRRVDDSGVPVVPGRYRVRLVGVDALGASDGTATTVVVTDGAVTAHGTADASGAYSVSVKLPDGPSDVRKRSSATNPGTGSRSDPGSMPPP
jgi:hypothetical protein